jgi:hypothetical protein
MLHEYRDKYSFRYYLRLHSTAEFLELMHRYVEACVVQAEHKT